MWAVSIIGHGENFGSTSMADELRTLNKYQSMLFRPTISIVPMIIISILIYLLDNISRTCASNIGRSKMTSSIYARNGSAMLQA